MKWFDGLPPQGIDGPERSSQLPPPTTQSVRDRDYHFRWLVKWFQHSPLIPVLRHAEDSHGCPAFWEWPDLERFCKHVCWHFIGRLIEYWDRLVCNFFAYVVIPSWGVQIIAVIWLVILIWFLGKNPNQNHDLIWFWFIQKIAVILIWFWFDSEIVDFWSRINHLCHSLHRVHRVG